MAEPINLGFRAVWEDYNVELYTDFDVVEIDPVTGWRWDHDHYSCPHVVDNKLPRVIVGSNEAGHNSVGICVDCLIEALGKWEKEKNVPLYKRQATVAPNQAPANSG